MRRIAQYTIIFISLFASAISFASESDPNKEDFYEKKAEGWFFYDDPVIPEEEEPRERPPAINATPKPTKTTDNGPPVYSAEWIKSEIPKRLTIALNDSTPTNVAAVAYLNRLMLDRSHNFSNVWRTVNSSDPFLQEGARSITNMSIRNSQKESVKNTKRAILSRLKDKVGIWYFVDQDCIHCGAQNPVLKALANKYELTVEYVNAGKKPLSSDIYQNFKTRQDSGQFASLGLKVVPAIVAVFPPEDFGVISHGYSTLSEVESRIFEYLNKFDLITDEENKELKPLDQGVLSMEQMAMNEDIDKDNPEEWLAAIRKQMGADNSSQNPSFREDLYTEKKNLKKTKVSGVSDE